MSQYIPDTCTADESEEKLFTATCLLASAMVDFCFDKYINCTGDSYEIYFSPEIGRPFTYNFDKEDYSAFLNFNEEEHTNIVTEDYVEADFE